MVIQVLERIIAFATGTVTIAQMFTGVFICRKIEKVKSTKGIPSAPFIGGLVLSILFLQQSRIIDDSTMKIVNFCGTALNCGYIAFYYYWTKKGQRGQLIRNLAKALGVALLLILYSMLERRDKVESRYGFIVSMVMLAFIVSPLRSIPEVVRKKSTENLPYPMIVMGLIVSSHWLVYSIVIGNSLLIVQNAIAITLCLIQYSLFIIYPDKTVSRHSKSKKTK